MPIIYEIITILLFTFAGQKFPENHVFLRLFRHGIRLTSNYVIHRLCLALSIS